MFCFYSKHFLLVRIADGFTKFINKKDVKRLVLIIKQAYAGK